MQTIQVIETAKVPIIKLTSTTENLSTDIAINDEYTQTTYCSSEGLAQHSGIAACELVKSYMRKIPAMAPIVLVLKQYPKNCHTVHVVNPKQFSSKIASGSQHVLCSSFLLRLRSTIFI